MASDWKPSVKEVSGVNLANYFPHQRSYNSVVFIHKKFLDKSKRIEESKEREKSKKEKKNKNDKCQQFSNDKITEVSKDRTYKLVGNNDSVLEQTIRFAKNIVPLVIPPSEDKLPVYYTIKTSRKHKKKDNKPQESSFEHHQAPFERPEAKKVIETYRKVKKESFSVRESVSHSSSNTLDDLNINQSLCCTFSEVSEKKYQKNGKTNHTKKQNERQKFTVSESFEALATENAGESRIKIHLMNEKDKNLLSDTIKLPILGAIKDCIAELNNNNHNTEITTVQKIVKCNTQKLDTIIDKLSCIEKRLDAQIQERKAIPKLEVPKVQAPQSQVPKIKTSKLEELSEDLLEIKEDYSSEEELHQELLDRRSKSAVIELVPEDKFEKNAESLGCGEVTAPMKASSSVGVKLDRPNRIPARFCWTDAARK